MNLFEHTYVINLKNRPDRLEHVNNEFNKLNIIPTRFNAVQTTDGAIGCTLSHIKCLELAIENNYDQIFICEDDITFTDVKTLQYSLDKFNKNIKTWDMLIIGGNVVKPYEQIDDYCLKISNCQTTTGYIVNKHYYSTLLLNFRTGVQQLLTTKNPKQFAIDIYWKLLQHAGKWYLLYPLTVTQYENWSDIEKRKTNYNHLMLDSKKDWLYKPRMTMNML
jgi:glycosyl transferase, family 25